jgi:hypothetical protein
MTTVNQKKFPPCYGDIDTVFPMRNDGLRHSPESCIPCSYKTDCLRKAMADKGGITVKEELVDRAYASGKVSFFERWSRRKALSLQKKKHGNT